MRGKQANGASRDPQPQRYQISVRGRLGQTMCAAFPVLQARTDGDQTVLTGMLADQAALSGVLAEIEALGLELLEVRRLPRRRPINGPASTPSASLTWQDSVRGGGQEAAELAA